MKKSVSAALAAPVIALALASCGGAKSDGNVVASAPVAATAAPAGKSWIETVSKTPDFGYRMGNPDAPLKLIEYGSRACPFCAQFDVEGFPQLKEKYIASGKVSYEFRDYPIHGALDVAPILLGHCVDESVFFPLLDAMMANQQTLLAKEPEVAQRVQAMGTAAPAAIATAFAEGLGYLDFVKQRGVPEAKARACLNDAGQLDALTKATNKANTDYQVSSTPTFILNGTPVVLSPTGAAWPQLESVLKRSGG
ncbi:thioredoxin domain-containing protein [Sphingomonas sp. MMS24-J45]|uniref:thioredoxin domain-containing protein n=1 Tax=Sphingomonas sp. MMS24-J45 TaxID=3238806 RepID=UPI00384B7500